MQLEGADIAGLFRRSAERARRRRPLVNPLAVLDAAVRPVRAPRADRAATRCASSTRRGARRARRSCSRPRSLPALNWDALRAHAASHLASGYYLALAWASYPVLKRLHELAHALAVRRWGGEVHEMGITLLFFTPAPYVDASAADGVPQPLAARRRERARASWSSSPRALPRFFSGSRSSRGVCATSRSCCSSCACASTLLFNANPLLRFDGYHALCDLIDAPNLALRSQAYWLHLARRVLGGDGSAAPARGPRRAQVAPAYAPLSWGYRLVLSAGPRALGGRKIRAARMACGGCAPLFRRAAAGLRRGPNAVALVPPPGGRSGAPPAAMASARRC